MRMTWMGLLICLVVVGSGCAIRDVTTPPTPSPSPAPPLSLPDAPAQAVGGSCAEAGTLAAYRQLASGLLEIYRARFELALVEPRDSLEPALVELARLRDETLLIAVPDCAQAAQTLLTASLRQGIDVLLTAYYDPAYDLAYAGPVVREMLASARTGLDEIESP